MINEFVAKEKHGLLGYFGTEGLFCLIPLFFTKLTFSVWRSLSPVTERSGKMLGSYKKKMKFAK